MRCDAALEKRSGRSVAATLACSAATFLLLFPANVLPLIRVDLLGVEARDVIASGVVALFDRGWFFLALASGVLVIILPFVRFGLLTAVLGAVELGRRPRWIASAFRWALWLDLWAMIDVYLLAAGVGYYRLAHVAEIHLGIGIGGYCFVAAALLTMLSRATLDEQTVWRAIGGETGVEPGTKALSCASCLALQPVSRGGEPCPRCRATLRTRRPGAIAYCSALLLAAFILVFPANTIP